MKNIKFIHDTSAESGLQDNNPEIQEETGVDKATNSVMPYIVDVSKENWWVRGNYSRIGSVNAADAWSSSLLAADKNVRITKRYVQATTAPAATGYNATVSYYDGTGMTRQSIEAKASPTGMDIVTPYDDAIISAGEVRSYLAYPVASAIGGQFRDEAISEQRSYYSLETGVSDPKAYIRQEFEISSRGQLTKLIRPGLDESKPTVYDTVTATMADKVLNISYLPAGGFTVAPTYRGTVRVTLKKSIINEEGHRTEVFVNEAGSKIMSRRVGPDGNADTYYVYDLYNRPVYIISPEGSAALEMGKSYSLDSEVTEHFCYIYGYDAKGRRVERKFPGKDWEYFVYDMDNRIIFSQDGNMRMAGEADDAGYWLRYSYDELGRMTAKSMNKTPATRTRASIQSLTDAGSEIKMARTALLAEYHYDSPFEYEYRNIDVEQTRWLAVYNSAENAKWSIASTDKDKVFFGSDREIKRDYLIGAYLNAQGVPYLAYYIPADHADIVNALVSASSNCVFTNIKPSSRLLPYVKTLVKAGFTFSEVTDVCTSADRNFRTRGLKTAEYIAVLGNGMNATGELVARFFYYDIKGRLIQIAERNIAGGISRFSSKYDFEGRIITHTEQHQASPNASVDTRSASYSYDSRGRLLIEDINLNEVGGFVGYSYDKLGQISSEDKGGTGNVIATTSYTRDMVGRITRMDTPGIYTENIVYTPNGKVISDRMQSPAFGIDNVNFTYSYDELDSLRKVVRSGQQTRAIYEMEYDLNGNITNLYNKSKKSYSQHYSYVGNMLDALNRSSDNNTERPGNYRFSYDANRNVTMDEDQDALFSYNSSNLIYAAGNHTSQIIYSWLADGTKVRITGNGAFNGIQYLYLGSVKYDLTTGEKTTLFPAGVISSTGKTTLHIKDRLGSVKVILEDKHPAAFNEYTPFGGLEKDYSIDSWQGSVFPAGKNTYLYNGKESQPGSLSPLLDYGSRIYNPRLARWTGPEPLMDMFPDYSPYCYCQNNPASMIDRLGLAPAEPGEDAIYGDEKIEAVVVTADRKHPSYSIVSLPFSIWSLSLSTADMLRALAGSPGAIMKIGIFPFLFRNYNGGGTTNDSEAEFLQDLAELCRENPDMISDIMDAVDTADDILGIPELIQHIDPESMDNLVARYPALGKYLKVNSDIGKVLLPLTVLNTVMTWENSNFLERTSNILSIASFLYWPLGIFAIGIDGINRAAETLAEAKVAMDDFFTREIQGKILQAFTGW